MVANGKSYRTGTDYLEAVRRYRLRMAEEYAGGAMSRRRWKAVIAEAINYRCHCRRDITHKGADQRHDKTTAVA